MTVVTRSPGAVGSGPWNFFTPENLAVGGVQPAEAYLNTTADKVQTASAFGFAIPADATITSLTVEGLYATSNVGYIALRPSSGVSAWEASLTEADWTVIQGVTNTGLPTVAQLNSADFAVTATASRPSGATSWVYLDYITLTVEYDEYVPPDEPPPDEPPPDEPPPPGVPTVLTYPPVSALDGGAATGGGNVISDGGTWIIARGVCWSPTDPNPTTDNPHTMDGSTTGEFASVLTGLTPGTFYHVRAFALNSAGIAYGADQGLITCGYPTVTLDTLYAITAASALVSGSVTSDGRSTLLARGTCWNTTGMPTIASPHTYEALGAEWWFTSSLTGLTPATTYHVRTYAMNSVGVGYSNEQIFVTHGPPTVATAGIYDILATNASGGGNVISDGGEAVTARGVCWGVEENPTTAPNIIPAMTSATTPSGTVSASSEFDASRAAWKAFDHGNPPSGTTGWITLGTTAGWLQYQFPAAHVATRYAVTSRNEASPYVRAPKTWTFKGSNNGTTWVTLDTRTNVTDWAATPNVRKVFDISNAVAYAYYRLDVSASNDASYVGVGELEVMEAADDDTFDGSGVGVFVSHLTGLTDGITYNVRAFATNPLGTTYGAAVSFTATADAPPVEPPLGPPRDPSENLLFDGTLELMIGTLDVAGFATQVKYSNSNPGGFGNLSFRLPADAPYAAFDAQAVKGAAVTMKHGLVGFTATLFEGEVTSDVSHATIAGGKAYYDVTCAGLWWKAGQRKDFSMVSGDDDYGQWYAMDDNQKVFNVRTDGLLEIRLEAGQSVAAGDSASLYYWLGKGMGDPAASIDFLFGRLSMYIPGANWHAEVLSAPTPWGSWTSVMSWSNATPAAVWTGIPITGDAPQALQIRLYTDSAVAGDSHGGFVVGLEQISVGSGVSANGLSAATQANIIPTMTSNTAPSGVASSSGVISGSWAAWMGFDHVNTSGGVGGCWVNYGATNYLQYQFPAARVITCYAITSRNVANPGAPKSWTFKGSNNGSTWVTLDTRTNITDWEAAYNTRHVYPFASSTAYAYYRLDITQSNNASYVGVGELEMMDATDVTADGAHELRTGDRVFIKMDSDSTPTISGWRTVTVTDGAHFTVPGAVTTAGGAGTFYKTARVDQALVEIAVTTGLATLARLQHDGIGNLNWGLNVRPHATRAGAIDLLAATNVAPFDYGFWDNATFHCKDRPEAIPPLHDYLIDSSLPGIDFDVRQATEDSPTVVKVLYKFRAAVGETSTYPDGTALAVYRDAGGAFTGDWTDAGIVLDVWSEWADLSLTTAQAGDLGDQILAWLSVNAYQGGGSIAPATVPLRAEGTKPAAYIRAGDYIEDVNLETGPLMITGFSMDADRGIATLGIGENRRAFVERLTPDKA